MSLLLSVTPDLRRYKSAITRYSMVGIVSAFAFLSTPSFAEAPQDSNLPTTEDGLRSLIGGGEPQRVCSSQSKYRACWTYSDRIAGYEETIEFSGWSVRCTMVVKSGLSARSCGIGGKGLSFSVRWQEAERRYEAHPRRNRLNSYAPVYVTIDGVVYISPEDSEYGVLELESESGEKVPALTLVRLIEKAGEIKTVSWDTNDQESSIEDQGAGFLDAHKFVIGFWDRTH